MDEKLTIRNFGPIRDMTFKLKVVNIFIGDQGTGKSTVAKLLAVIKELIVFPNRYKDLPYWKMERDFEDQLEIYGITNYLKSDSYIEFEDSFTYFKYENKKIEIKEDKKEGENKSTDVIEYIPAYREAAILLKDSLNAIAAAGARLPKLFYYFGQRLINAKKAKTEYNYVDILDVKYKFSNEKDIIILKNEGEIEIDDASSAINSGIPMLLAFDNAIESMQPKNNRIFHKKNQPYIIIEEPEINFFPETQKKIMEYFISRIKYDLSKSIWELGDNVGYYCGLIITTHSPYILTSLNNMMYAYTVGQKEPKEVNEIIKSKYWMNPEKVSAYMLLTSGEHEDIFDREEGLIKAEKIDGVTNILNEKFDALLNIELVPK